MAVWARQFVLEPAALSEWQAMPKHGVPGALSRDHQQWPAIDEAIVATQLVTPPPPVFWDRAPIGNGSPAALASAALPPAERDARALFHQRRSAVAMDGKTGTDAASFCASLSRVVQPTSPALQPLPWRSRVHLVLFVHRVEGLVPGCYCLVRGGQDVGWLRERMRSDFLWERPANVPAALPLFLLFPLDCRDIAREVCCHQDIAADSAFAVLMLAEFAETLDTIGAWAWRLLHWEAGAIGQLLYLEAEAAGLRATGIGCFFDSAVHDLLGVSSEDLRTIYHFTTGGAVDDARLQTDPPYGSGH